jgi:hypothetical protein
LVAKREDDDMVMVLLHHRRDHHSSVAWDSRAEVVVPVPVAAVGHAAKDTRGIVAVVRAARIPSAAKDTVPVAGRTRFQEEDTEDIDHHHHCCENSREDSALDHTPTPSCQSYYVLPQPQVVSIALAPKNRIDCRTPKDTFLVVLDRTLLEFGVRTEGIPTLRRSPRDDARTMAAAAVVVRSGPFPWV